MLGAAALGVVTCGSDDQGGGSSDEPALLSPDGRAEIRKQMTGPPFQYGKWGVLAVDTDSGETLFARNIKTPLRGASTTKNFTVAATLGDLGPDHRFRTPVVRLGPVPDGTLKGDLVLQASGDLTMGGRDEGDDEVAYTGFDHTDANEVPGPATLTPQDPLVGLNRLAEQVSESGIERVAGDVIIDDRLWKSKRIGTDLVTPIIVNDNAIDITLTPTEPGQTVEAETRPATAAYTINVETETGPPGSPVAPEVEQTDDREVTVTGSIPADGGPVVQIFRSPDPAYLARTLFIEALKDSGVKVDAPVVAPNRSNDLPPFGKVSESPKVAEITSPPVSEFVKLIQKVSHNLGSNTAPFWLATQHGERTFAAGMKRVRGYARQAGVPMGQVTLVDGQGLEGNQFSPLAMVTLLRYVAQQPYAADFADALPVKGVDGLPEDPEKDPGTGHVSAKNGLLGGLNSDGELEVQAMALAGYAGTGESQVSFDVAVNHVPILPDGKSSDDPQKQVEAFTRFGPLEGITTEFYLAGK